MNNLLHDIARNCPDLVVLGVLVLVDLGAFGLGKRREEAANRGLLINLGIFKVPSTVNGPKLGCSEISIYRKGTSVGIQWTGSGWDSMKINVLCKRGDLRGW